MLPFSYRAMGSKGFSLLELIMVMTIAGVLIVVSGVRWPGMVFIQAQAEQLAQDIRYTQALAMGRGKGHTIQWLDVNSYGIMDSEGNQVSPYPLVLDGVVIEPFSVSFSSPMGSPAASYQPIRIFREGESLSLIVTDLTGTVIIQP